MRLVVYETPGGTSRVEGMPDDPGYLATEECPFNGGVFHVGANEVGLYGGWSLQEGNIVVTDGRWTVADLATKAPRLLEGRGSCASMVTAIGDTFKGYGKRQPSP